MFWMRNKKVNSLVRTLIMLYFVISFHVGFIHSVRKKSDSIRVLVGYEAIWSGSTRVKIHAYKCNLESNHAIELNPVLLKKKLQK